MRRIGTILTYGNKSEFKDIRKQLIKRGIEWFERRYRGRAIVFWFYEAELHKLPLDIEHQGDNKFPQYLPVDNESGHGIGCIDKFLEANPGKDIKRGGGKC